MQEQRVRKAIQHALHTHTKAKNFFFNANLLERTSAEYRGLPVNFIRKIYQKNMDSVIWSLSISIAYSDQ